MSVLEAKNRLEGTLLKDLDEADGEDLVFDGEVIGKLDTLDGADVDTQVVAFKARCAMEIVEVVACPGAAVTANDTNNALFTLAKQDGAGGGATTIATLQTNVAGGSWVADVFKTFTITQANKRVSRGQLVTLKKTTPGTGVAVGPCSFTIKYRKV